MLGAPAGQGVERPRQLGDLLRRESLHAQAVRAADARAPAQELLHLPLVAVARVAVGDRPRPQVAAECEDGLPRGRAEAVAGRLELAVVEAAAVAELLEHLRRDAHADGPQRGGGETGAP